MTKKWLSPLQKCLNAPSIPVPPLIEEARKNGFLVGGGTWVYPTGEFRPAETGEYTLRPIHGVLHCRIWEHQDFNPRWIATEDGVASNNLRGLDQHLYAWGTGEYKVVSYTEIPAGRLFVTASNPHVQVSTGGDLGYLLEFVREVTLMWIQETPLGWTVIDSTGKRRLFRDEQKEPWYLPSYEQVLQIVASQGVTPVGEDNSLNLPAGTLVTLEKRS